MSIFCAKSSLSILGGSTNKLGLTVMWQNGITILNLRIYSNFKPMFLHVNNFPLRDCKPPTFVQRSFNFDLSSNQVITFFFPDSVNIAQIVLQIG
jgi:hypothetical protein